MGCEALTRSFQDQYAKVRNHRARLLADPGARLGCLENGHRPRGPRVGQQEVGPKPSERGKRVPEARTPGGQAGEPVRGAWDPRRAMDAAGCSG
jgi:hypothetical protein